MESIIVLGILAILTLLSFVLFRPKKKDPLGSLFWNTQTMTSNELAKMFAFQNEVDRLIEMLCLSPSKILEASNHRAAAAATGIPVLYQRHVIPWEQTEIVIESLLNAIDDVPEEAIHAISALSVGKHLGILEDTVVTKLVIMLQKSDNEVADSIKVKICNALGYIGNYLAVEPLTDLVNSTASDELKKASAHALSRIGVNTSENGNTSI